MFLPYTIICYLYNDSIYNSCKKNMATNASNPQQTIMANTVNINIKERVLHLTLKPHVHLPLLCLDSPHMLCHGLKPHKSIIYHHSFKQRYLWRVWLCEICLNATSESFPPEATEYKSTERETRSQMSIWLSEVMMDHTKILNKRHQKLTAEEKRDDRSE